jgi:2-dehydro-3-deoxygluconokinase
MAAAVTFGEAMLRLSPPGRRRLEQAQSLDLWPAGSELNVAIGLARLGTPSAWVSRLPSGPLGRIVDTHARAQHVDTSHVLWADDGRLGLYFVEVGDPPRATTAQYDRAGSAFALLDPDELDWPTILSGAEAFHVSGITPALSPACARAAADALAAGRAAGCHTSYDVNLRRRLTTPDQAAERLEEVAGLLDAVLCSQVDADALFGLTDADALRDRLGVPLVVMSTATEGRRARIAVGDTTEELERPEHAAIDPIGSGDAFAAGFLHGLLRGGLRYGLELGDAMSVLKLTVPGDAPLVDPHEVEALLAGTGARVHR